MVMTMTKLEVETLDGEVLYEADVAIEETAEAFYERPVIVWNGRVFMPVDIPDCDAPEDYGRYFTEVPVVFTVNGDMAALAERLDQLAENP